LHQIFECGSNQPRRWARIGAPRYVALALAAVLQNIPPGRLAAAEQVPNERPGRKLFQGTRARARL
jgi:hypothetical protein